ncbi:MAG TPA: plastocyanin/azurin family copper-binding protein [Baekduia sp.]|nr:plastocyanin/azurin family copper-binding protein [Baekduia sp.]
MNRLRTSVLLAAGAAALAAAPAEAGNKTVVLKGLDFSPSTVTVKRGDTVTWVWRDGAIKHDVKGKGFKSSALKAKGTHKVRFTRKGTFRYVCSVHGTMVGKVVVR